MVYKMVYARHAIPLAVGLLALGVSLPAWAGFELKLPPQQATAPAPAPIPVAPTPPALTITAPGTGAPVGLLPSGGPGGAGKPHQPSQPEPVKLAGVVDGFGSDLPLEAVIEQLVPSGKKVVYGAGVKRDVLLSWRGGRHWRDVLGDSLLSVGLKLVEEGERVQVEWIEPPLPELPAWEARGGEMLRSVLERWRHQAGVVLKWESEFDFPLEAPVRIQATFQDAVLLLLRGFATANPQPHGILNPNTETGQPVLVVRSRGGDHFGR